ncbi:MAG: hydroxymethylglutaryl-CoA synthase family protein [Desulfomonile tiedjei]|uniref:Hydroxymethylglutaryl-CoA synthase family protein n=1 Tax=Desulfomonile tiedjei TaxID=2358 RepID=A0A9D6V5K6_9BACT|nr:hydroxymethylglutaryl-CoA synthase family protein [Desulfomonile tiedjei]
MVGIKSYGVYVPFHRLDRTEIAKFWSGYRVPGEKAVANFDEDSVTMGVEACRDCLLGFDINAVRGLCFTSTTSPYAEKQSAALIATTLDLSRTTRTIDVSGSLRSGTSAVRVALDAVNGGGSGDFLVCSSDLRLGLPNGSKEMEFGDGAAAFLIGDSDPIASIDNAYTVNNELYDVYRPVTDQFVRSWEDRFVREIGFMKVVPETVRSAFKEFGMGPEDFTRAVISAPNPSYLGGVAGKLGFDPKSQAIDPLWGLVGNLGAAHPMVLLAAALEQSKPGDRILWVSYGDGCDVYALTVTENILSVQGKRSVERMLNSKSSTSYQKYLRWRDLVSFEPPNRPREEPASAVALHRDRKCGLALFGSKCTECGTVQYPVQRVCMECRSKDKFDYYPFADKKGKIATFSHDSLAVSPDPPTTLAAVDFEEGGRIMMDVTDRDVSKIEVGTPVEMTFRRFRQTGGITVYWWKSRPVR